MLKKNWWLIVVLVVGLFLRVVKLDYLELFGDELDAGYQAYSLGTYGTDYKGHLLPVYAQSFSEWRAPGLMYAMIPSIKFFGLNEWGVRLTPAFFGVLSLVLFYWLLKETGVNRKISILAIGIIAICPWHIQYSRSAFELTLLACLLLFGSILLIKSIKKSSYWLTLLAAMIFSLSFYTYNTANVYVPLLSLLIFIFYKKKIISRQMLFFVLVGTTLASPIVYQIFWGHAADRFNNFSVFGSKEVSEEIINYRNANKNKLTGKIFFNKLTVGGKKILFNYSNAFSSSFLTNQGDVTFRHSLHQVGNIFWIMFLMAILGLIINKNWFWVGFLLISPIPASLTIDGYNHASRLFMMIFPLSYFAAYGFEKIQGLIRWIVIIVLVFEFLFFQNYYWNYYRTESWRWWHFGYKQVMSELTKNIDNHNRIYVENTYEPALIRYLFWLKVDPKLVYKAIDKMDSNIGDYKGFCLDRVCFVDYGMNFETNTMVNGDLYLVSQSRNVPGNWDWEKNPPESIRVINTVRSPDDNPLFYLIEKR